MNIPSRVPLSNVPMFAIFIEASFFASILPLDTLCYKQLILNASWLSQLFCMLQPLSIIYYLSLYYDLRSCGKLYCLSRANSQHYITITRSHPARLLSRLAKLEVGDVELAHTHLRRWWSCKASASSTCGVSSLFLSCA